MAKLTEDELKSILGDGYRPGINDGPSFLAGLWRTLVRTFGRLRTARQG